MFNIESLVDIVWSIIPPITKLECEYFENTNQLLKNYEESNLKNYTYTPNPTDPEMLLHEFIFILGRIAQTTVNNTDSQTPSITEKLGILLKETLKFKPVENPTELVEKYYHNGIAEMEDGMFSSDEEEDEDYQTVDNPQRILHEFLMKRLEEESSFAIDYSEVLKELESDLPEVPKLKEQEQVNPPPYAQPRILFGKLLPKPPADDKKNK
jgi:hypothetical protein